MSTLYDRLVAGTEAARAGFLSIPLLGRAISGDVPPALYVRFLNQAYHHVRHTCPLLSLAAARTDDGTYRDALYEYIDEERGHEEWILADIAAITGRPHGDGIEPAGPPCRAMVGYAYYAIEWISPYALLGMVHVLEGMSTLLASKAAQAMQDKFGPRDGDGFLYLSSHGELDVGHTAFFRETVNRLKPSAAEAAIVDCAGIMYWLYGNIFRDLERGAGEVAHVACG